MSWEVVKWLLVNERMEQCLQARLQVLAIVVVGPIARQSLKEIGKLEVMLMGLAR